MFSVVILFHEGFLNWKDSSVWPLFFPSLRICFLRGGRGGAAGVFHGAGRGPPPFPCRAERPSLEKTMSDYAPGILHGWLSAALSAVRQPIGKGGARSQSERDGARPNIFFSTRGLQEYFFGSWLSDCEFWLNIVYSLYWLIWVAGILSWPLLMKSMIQGRACNFGTWRKGESQIKIKAFNLCSDHHCIGLTIYWNENAITDKMNRAINKVVDSPTQLICTWIFICAPWHS